MTTLTNEQLRSDARIKELCIFMRDRFSMNPVSCKILGEEWNKTFPDECAVADVMLGLLTRVGAAEARLHDVAVYCANVEAQLAELQKQEPVAWRCLRNGPNSYVVTLAKSVADDWENRGFPLVPLYAAPVAPAASQPVRDYKDEFLGACQTLATITEMLEIPEDDVDGEPLQIFEAIEALKQRAIQPPAVPDDVARDALRYRFLRDKDAFGADNEPGLASWDDLFDKALRKQPVVPDEKTRQDYQMIHGGLIGAFDHGHLEGWNACRAAMLDATVEAVANDALRTGTGFMQVSTDGVAHVPRDQVLNHRIKPVLPERDAMGFWSHPDRPETPFDEGSTLQEMRTWYAERGMEVDFTYMNQFFCGDCVYDA
ncbi:hypothetical protein DDT54_18855, partial [Brenneria nigrifluens DSM 30175 = ATCC 13028]